MTRLTITKIHPADAHWKRRRDFIGFTFVLDGRIVMTADMWFNFTVITPWGSETFMYAQFERIKE